MNQPTHGRHAWLLCLPLLFGATATQARDDVVELRSANGGYTTYRLPRDTSQVNLTQQLQGSCRFNRSWGYDLTRRELWTDRGCGGRFRVVRDHRDNKHSSSGATVAAVAAIAGIALLAQQNRPHNEPPHAAYPGQPGYPPQTYPHPTYPPQGGYPGGPRGGPIRSEGGLCLDVYRGQFRPGTPVQAYHCTGVEGQRFTPGPNGEIRVRDLCLDIEGGNLNDGARVILWNCAGSPNQSWSVRGGQIVSQFHGKCLDLREGQVYPESPAMVWSCNASPSQRWAW